MLDVGCVQQDYKKTRDPKWLHGLIVRQAQSVLAMVILEENIKELSSEGYRMVTANIETMELGEKFEVVVAGDITEHLSNPGFFMDRVFGRMLPGGAFLIITLKPVTFLRLCTALRTGRVGANSEYTCRFTSKVMEELASRSDLKVVEIARADYSLQHYAFYPKIWQLLVGINSLLCRVRPQIAETICCHLQHAEDAG